MNRSAHEDPFTRSNLPPPEQWPELVFDLPELQFPERLNCARMLLDQRIEQGDGDRPCLIGDHEAWTYAELRDRVDRIAHVLVKEMGLVTGNRVLLRSVNSPMMAACWFAVVKAGGVAVATMPLLRAKELTQIIHKARISHALCDEELRGELDLALKDCPELTRRMYFNGAAPDRLQARMADHPQPFAAVDTASDDVALIAFTSGTTGQPKGTMHFHRDLMAACACWPAHMLRASADDVFIGSPPLAFTFGLGGVLLFPMSVGASTVLVGKTSPAHLLDAIERHRVTVVFTAPTSYRAMAEEAARRRIGAPHGGCLRKSVSAGEVLPAATRALWKAATGIEMMDGLGATEMLHIFISTDEDHARPGATGTVVPGYQARVVDEQGRPVPDGTIGRLAVKGPTGCRYLDDERQLTYVRQGWNFTGDAYLRDADGYFHFQARTDDMIVSSGYNIGAPEVEDVLMAHPKVAECAVIGVPDEARGQVVKAFVVLRPGHEGEPVADLVDELQRFVRETIAPYKYPRQIEFLAALPRTDTGKLQRFRLRASK